MEGGETGARGLTNQHRPQMGRGVDQGETGIETGQRGNTATERKDLRFGGWGRWSQAASIADSLRGVQRTA